MIPTEYHDEGETQYEQGQDNEQVDTDEDQNRDDDSMTNEAESY